MGWRGFRHATQVFFAVKELEMNRMFVDQPSPSSLIHGWGASLLLHGVAIAAAIWVAADIKPVVPKEPFRWEVAVVQPAPQEPLQEAPMPPQPTRQEVSPRAARPVVEARMQPTTEIRPAEEKPVVETRPATQVVQTQAIQRVERTIERTVTQAAQPTSVEKQVQHAEHAVTQVEPLAAQQAVTAREPAAVASTSVARVERESVPQSAVQSTIERPAAPVQTAPIVETVVRTEVSKPAELISPPVAPKPAEPPTPSVHTPPAQTVPVHAAPSSRADFGWLKDLLARKIKEVKRYPHTARLNHLEGKVIVHAVIKEDGNLADLRIHESSGHDILDEDALETMRKACPLHMNHPLGRPQMAIRIPISYSLND